MILALIVGFVCLISGIVSGACLMLWYYGRSPLNWELSADLAMLLLDTEDPVTQERLQHIILTHMPKG